MTKHLEITKIVPGISASSGRHGFFDSDDFGFGLVAKSTWTGCLDAPDLMPCGSMTESGTTIRYPQIQIQRREN